MSGSGSERPSPDPLVVAQADKPDASADEPGVATLRPSSVAVDGELLALRDQLDRLSARIAALNDRLSGQPALPKWSPI